MYFFFHVLLETIPTDNEFDISGILYLLFIILINILGSLLALLLSVGLIYGQLMKVVLLLDVIKPKRPLSAFGFVLAGIGVVFEIYQVVVLLK